MKEYISLVLAIVAVALSLLNACMLRRWHLSAQKVKKIAMIYADRLAHIPTVREKVTVNTVTNAPLDDGFELVWHIESDDLAPCSESVYEKREFS